MYQAVGDDFAIFASYAGGPKNPAWFHNLVANAAASVEVGADTVQVTARVASADEREAIWTTQKERYPQFAEYEEKTDREIPVVLLKRRG
jgi:deazaflavin-dependent oxidoreductase (nitroreductase family)